MAQLSEEVQIARLKLVAKRYLDAYRIARATVRLGYTIKILGALLAGLLILGAFLLTGFGAFGGVEFVIFVTAAISAGIVWLAFFVLGVLVSAQAQIMLASLDGAVHSSPFLLDDEKAKIMGLPMP